MAKHTTTAWATFPTREDAEQAIQRLSSGGFARNSIDLDRRQDGRWEVTVHTRPHNTERVNALLRAPSPMYAVERRNSGTVESLMGNPLVLAGAAALAGTIIYSLLPGNRRSVVQAVRRFPSQVRETVENLPEMVRDAVSTVQETVSDLPDAVRGAVSTGSDDKAQRS